MKFPMPREYKYIRPIDQVWYGEPHYKESLSVPEITAKYGSLSSKLKTMPSYMKYLIGALWEINKSVKSIKHNPYENKTQLAKADLEQLLSLCDSHGISNIGFTQIKTSHLFRESIVLFRNAIVFTMEMKKSEVILAPSKETNIEIFRTYYELGKSVNIISEFLRSKGYNAQPIPAIGSNVNLSVLAKDAGLGYLGKSGLLITPDFGPSIRLSAVLTDIENLPLNQEIQHKWIQNFCNKCNACVRKCPAGAIYENPIVFEDGSEQHIDYKKCAQPFSRQYGCTICVKECAFFKSDYHNIHAAFHKNK